MPAHHDDDCDCSGCLADVDRFWREQEGEPDPDMPPESYEFDVADLDDVTPLPPAPVAPLSDIERARGESIVDGVMDGFAAGLGMTREQLEVATGGAVPAPKRSRAKRRR